MSSPHPLTILPTAEAELDAASTWYEAQRVGLGHELVETVRQTLAEISARPEAFAPWSEDPRCRRAVVQRFPYVLVFELRGATIEVVAVAHTKRRPGYWADRPR